MTITSVNLHGRPSCHGIHSQENGDGGVGAVDPVGATLVALGAA